MLNLQRRHIPQCPLHGKPDSMNDIRCKGVTLPNGQKKHCPFRAAGTLPNGQKIRVSLKTADAARARARLVEMESGVAAPDNAVTLKAAIDAYMRNEGIGEATRKKYTRTLGYLSSVAAARGVSRVNQADVHLIHAYREFPEISLMTWSKELAILRTFFSYCGNCGWIKGNPAALVKMPKVDPALPDPYTDEELGAMLRACDEFGLRDYERKRARAMLCLLRNTALRIGDVALMKRSRIQGDRVHVRTEKNKKEVFIRLLPYTLQALAELPPPAAAGENPEYLFWSGNGSPDSMKRSADRTLRAVFAKAGLDDAHAHRFRHSLVVELLVQGLSFPEISEVIGSSAPILQKHYAPWDAKRQERVDSLMQKAQSSTFLTQTKSEFSK